MSKTSNNAPLRVGLAGYGIVGRKRHSYIDAHSAFTTVAICEKRSSEHEKTLPSISWFTNYRDLFRQDLDVVFVCMSNDMAAEVSVESLKRGFHTFCEKPPARNSSELASVLEAEQETFGLKLKYGFNHRYHESVRQALEIVERGSMGRVLNIRGVYGKSNLITFDQTDWRTKHEIAGGGILLDQGIHLVDLARLFGGHFNTIYSFISNDYWKYNVEDNAYVLMKSDQGVVAMIHSSATQWKHKFRLEIGLEDGMLNLSGILSGSQSYGEETLTIVPAKSLTEQDGLSETKKEYTEDNSWSDEISDFADDILMDRPVSTGSSTDAQITMELIEQIYAADNSWTNK